MNTLSDLARFIGLRASEACAVREGGGSLSVHQFDVDPYEFLVRAEQDLELGGDGSELNAITNARRAIACQMDQALLSFGYPAGQWRNVDRKITVLNRLGLAAPRILKRVADVRNLLEHEYRKPRREDTEDAVDVATLFVASVKPILDKFGDEFRVGNRSEWIDDFTFRRELLFGINYVGDAPVYDVRAVTQTGEVRKVVGETNLSWRDETFPVVVRLALAADRDFKLEKAMADFCEAVGIH